MIEQRFKEIGPLLIDYPDENTELFRLSLIAEEVAGYPNRFDAFEWLESNITNVEPKDLDYDGHCLTLSTLDIELLLAAIVGIRDLAATESRQLFPTMDIDTWRQEFIEAKNTRPLPQVWENGDVFTIPLRDNTFSCGQVLDSNFYLMALFKYRSDHEELSPEIFQTLKPISLLRISNASKLNERKWTVLFKEPITDFSELMHDPNFQYATYRRFGPMDELAEAYWGITFWNIHYHDDHFNKLLLPNVSRPDTARILSLEEKQKYWREVLKSDYPYK